MDSWSELVIEGPRDVGRAFVTGFLAARDAVGGAVFDDDVDLEPASLGARILGLLAAGSHQACFAPTPLARVLAEALGVHGADLGLRVEQQRELGGAEFAFSAETSARDVAERIRQTLVAAAPRGVRVEDLKEEEEKHPEAKGIELYAPMHSYTYRVSGRIVGDVGGVLDVRRGAREVEVVEVGKLHVKASG